MLDYLLELRKRALLLSVIFLLFFFVYYFYANPLFLKLLTPLMKVLPKESYLIATQLSSPLLIPLQLAVNAALLTTLPFVLWQFWCFIAPGLYLHEQRLFKTLLTFSFCLFLVGLSFCYFFILPFMLEFFVKALPQDIHFLPDMSFSFDFISKMLLIFGLAFQIPVICLFLTLASLVELASLKQIRPFVIVAAFFIGMILTPPDVLSQVLLAVPLCLLYELGLFLASIFVKPKISQKKSFKA